MTDVLVILDGVLVEPSEVTPEKHRYIGMFRPPNPKPLTKEHAHRCPTCNQGMYTSMGNCLNKHWHQGCFDVPQYVSIKEDDE